MSGSTSSGTDIAQRASTVLRVLDAISTSEALKIVKGNLDTVGRTAALNRIKVSKDKLKSIIDGLPKPSASDKLTDVEEAHADCALTYVETVVAQSPSADMRIAQFTGYEKLKDDHEAEFKRAEASPDPKKAMAELADKIRQTAMKLREIAKHPEKLLKVVNFWDKLVRPDPGLSKFQLIGTVERKFTRDVSFTDIMENDLDTEEVFADVVDGLKQTQQEADLQKLLKLLQLTAKDLEIAAKWLGAAVALLAVTTLVLNAVADDRHWASEVAKASVSIGTGILLSEASSALLSAADAALVSAGITAEAVPVALFLVVTGVVLLVAYAVSELFAFLLDTIFGGPIPKSMRAEMQVPMSASTRLSMSAPMLLPTS